MIGVPKTVDNDLPVTDSCPGFGSVAKYTAVSVLEASLDVESMCESSTKVFVMEVMGRHAGWIAAAAGLAGKKADDPPHIILFPEVPFDEAKFLDKVKQTVERVGYCTVVVSEGVKNAEGKFLAEAGTVDAFGHTQLGGVGPLIAQRVKEKLGYKYHWAVPDYLQRSARHLASKSDAEQAYAVGKAAVEYALAGKTGVMPLIKRTSNTPFTWKIVEVPITQVANIEKKLPANYISADGFSITPAARRYFEPLIRGQDVPPYDATIGLAEIREAETQTRSKEIAGVFDCRQVKQPRDARAPPRPRAVADAACSSIHSRSSSSLRWRSRSTTRCADGTCANGFCWRRAMVSTPRGIRISCCCSPHRPRSTGGSRSASTPRRNTVRANAGSR